MNILINVSINSVKKYFKYIFLITMKKMISNSRITKNCWQLNINIIKQKCLNFDRNQIIQFLLIEIEG